MSAYIRKQWLAIAFAGFGVWTMVYLGLYSFAWTDYDIEATPAYDALGAGHVWHFFQLAPAYGGSLELRAPFALLPALWHGGEQSRFELVSIPCLVAAGILAIWLYERLVKAGASQLARWTTLGLVAANPITVYACEAGHAEEVLGAVLCVVAVLAAERRRVALAGLVLGLAIVNKEWGLLAIGPVLVALPQGRIRALSIAGAVSAIFYLPLVLAQTGAGSGLHTLGTTGSIFLPWQWWWFLGSGTHAVSFYLPGALATTAVATPPAWLTGLTHPLIIALGLPLSLLAARRRGVADPLLLLALLMLMRCALDPWDTTYYALPFIFSLAAWETLRMARAPLGALAATAATWLVFVELPLHYGADTQGWVFLCATVPAAALLALALYSDRRIRWRAGRSAGLARSPVSLASHAAD